MESMEELLRQEAARLRARRTRRATTARRVAAVESCAEGVVREFGAARAPLDEGHP